MRFTQTNDRIIITQSGAGQVVAGTVFAIVGGAVAAFGLSGKAASTNQIHGGSHAGLWVSVAGISFFAIGLLVALTARKQQTTLVRSGEGQISTKGLFGGAKKHNFSTASITKVLLHVYMAHTAGQNSSNQIRSQLLLILQDNAQIPLADEGSTSLKVNGLNVGDLVSRPPLSSEAERVATFLNVPLETADTTSLSGLAETAREVITQAIKPEAPSPSGTPTTTPNTAAPQPPDPTQSSTPPPPTAT